MTKIFIKELPGKLFSYFDTGIIHLVHTQNFLKNENLLPPDTHMNVCVSGGNKCSFFGKFCVRTLDLKKRS